jgi:hypothetical protein
MAYLSGSTGYSGMLAVGTNTWLHCLHYRRGRKSASDVFVLRFSVHSHGVQTWDLRIINDTSVTKSTCKELAI